MSASRVLLRSLSAAACACLLAFPVLAQSDRATLTGTILDVTGAAIPGTRITITSEATNAASTITSNEAGAYTVPNLPAGQYTVRAEKEGFKPAIRTALTLSAASTARLDIPLEIGTSQQAVEVQANAELLQTDNAKVSVTINNKLVDELPLVVGGAMRSPFDLAQLTPEAKNYGDQGFSIGGGQASSFGITLDGVSAATTRALQTSWATYNAPSLEAISEFTVDSNGFKAEFGHAAGGTMTFASKSGTNEYHGTAYEFLRNNAFDARRFFEKKVGVYKQHDFGASFGGPVWIPKIYNGKDKTFFFLAYEGFRNRVGASTVSQSVPTPEMYNGDFSKWVDARGNVIPIFDPATTRANPSGSGFIRDPFPNNMIPASRFDPLAVKLIGVYQSGPGGKLAPNTGAVPGTSEWVRANYLITQGAELNPWSKKSVKIDHIFSERNRIAGYVGINRIFKNPGPDGPPTLPGYYTTYNDAQNLSDVYRLSWDHTFSPTILNHFYAGGNNWREGHFSPNELLGNWKGKYCEPNVPDCDHNLHSVTFSEFNQWGGPSNNGSENTVFSFNDDLNFIKGRHSFKLGVVYQRNHYNGFGQQWDMGLSQFSYTETGIPGGTDPNKGGNSFASFLLGQVDQGQIHTVRFISQQWPYYAGYFQDDFRVNNKLTLNLGIRWETTLPPVEANDKWSDFAPDRPNPAAGGIKGALIYAGTGEGREGSRALADSYFGAFGPHIGFAYSANSKTVIRGSYSRSFAAITTVTGSTHQRGFTLTTAFPNLTSGVQPTYILSQGMPPWQAPPFISPSFANGDNIPWWQGQEATRPPENNTWNLSIQRSITQSLIFETSYNANIGSHLQAGLLAYNQIPFAYFQQYGRSLLNSNINSADAVAAGIPKPYPSFNGSVAQSLRPFPQYTGIDTASGGGDHSGHSSYHALLFRVEKRYSSGLQFQTSYVFSKLLTDADSYWPGSAAMDHFNRGLEKSIGQFDTTHNFKFGGVYELPFGKGKPFLSHGFLSAIIGNWRLGAVTYYSSGLPVALGTTIGFPIFNGGNRPTITTYDGWRGQQAGDRFDPQTDRFLQPASFFGPQPTDQLGNATRYNPKLRQFPNLNENISLAKSFPITERFRIDFRAEAFNLFNRVRFGTGPTTLQDNNFGRLTSNSDIFNDPRRLQFGLKLYF